MPVLGLMEQTFDFLKVGLFVPELLALSTYMQIFMLSAISPTKMPLVLQNLNKVLKVGG